jgi:beta-N-acetylhexosaminidase
LLLAAAVPASASAHALSVRQLAGQRVVFSYSGLQPPAALLARIRAGEAAGVIFFSDNVTDDAQLHRVARRLQRAAAHSPVSTPLLLMTDQEGGLVRRLPGAPVASARQIGASAHPVRAARRAGRGAALNLRSAGLNVNLAPVLDVFRSPGNFIDEFGRSFGMDPLLVSRAGAAFATAEQANGVAATVKHFPGLGAAARGQNTDLGPVTLPLSRHVLRTVDELPYRAAIAGGVRLVMLSWARYPALGGIRPAGLARVIVHGELRRRLGFRGVTITDALEAGALRSFGGISSRAVRAARAGMDLLLCSGRDPSEGARAVRALARALRAGRLHRGAFTAAVARVQALRAGF